MWFVVCKVYEHIWLFKLESHVETDSRGSFFQLCKISHKTTNLMSWRENRKENLTVSHMAYRCIVQEHCFSPSLSHTFTNKWRF